MAMTRGRLGAIFERLLAEIFAAEAVLFMEEERVKIFALVEREASGGAVG